MIDELPVIRQRACSEHLKLDRMRPPYRLPEGFQMLFYGDGRPITLINHYLANKAQAQIISGVDWRQTQQSLADDAAQATIFFHGLRKSWTDLDIRMVVQYAAALQAGYSVWTQKKLAKKTIHRRIGTVLQIAKFARLNGWVPIEALRDYLNTLPGPPLTLTDVSQRLKAFEEEPYSNYPDDDLRDSCLAIFAKEAAEGTELPAIIRLLSEYVEDEQQRIRLERTEQYKRMRAQERHKAEQRLLSGADCGWTQLGKRTSWYCRKNGRTFRLQPTRDKRWEMHRVDGLSADEKGRLIGTYSGRGDATKVISKIAYQPETRF